MTRSLLPSIVLVAVGGSFIGAGGLRGCAAPAPSPGPQPTVTATPAPCALPEGCDPLPTPTPAPEDCIVREDGLWLGADGLHLEQTRYLIRAAQRDVGDSCGLPYPETNEVLVERLEAGGACAGVMGEDAAEVFIRVESGPQAGLYEQWHPTHAGTGCIVTGPQKGLWRRLP